MVFLLCFAMIGVMFEEARTLSSDGYVKVAARSAAMTVFGDFNRELYEEYGLFAYGGYDGIGAAELNMDFLEILQDNLTALPENNGNRYSDLYRFRELNSEVTLTKTLMEKTTFYEQIQGYLKRQAVEDITSSLSPDSIKGSSSAGAKEKLAITKDYESGKYDAMAEETPEAAAEEGQEIAEPSDQKKASEKELSEDAAGGNPLDTFSELAGNGVLHLVCDENQISKEQITGRATVAEEADSFSEQEFQKGAADYLGDLIDTEEKNETIWQTAAKKSELLIYASRQFADYTTHLEKTTKYGLEYLIAGKEKENLNLSYVVTRLLGIRMLTNLSYVMSDPVLLEKSMKTATLLAGFTGLPMVVSAVQYTILMILSFQEACIDVTALLEGRQIPLTKHRGNFQMRYEEICIATKSLFHAKASAYTKEEHAGSTIGYKKYLYLFCLLKSEEVLRERMGDLIQYDLRERYNQTFSIDTCICESTYRILFQVPYLFDTLPLLSETSGKRTTGEREQEVTYGYKSR